MILRRKMALQTAALIVGLLLVSAAGLWGMNGLTQDFSVALQGNEELRWVFEVAAPLTAARDAMNAGVPDRERAGRDVERAVARFAAETPSHGGPGPRPARVDVEMERFVRADLRAILEPLRVAFAPDELSGDGDLADLTQSALGQVSALAARIRTTIEQKQADARRHRVATMVAMAVISAAALAAAVLIGIFQYRSVTRPLTRLGHGVREIAAGKLSERLPVTGDDEFAALARDFNRMAEELDSLYRTLEQKVAEKSRELVRSERLASVGYLAAGVAHEINNPLGIIAGYAELALKQFDAPPGGGGAQWTPAEEEAQRTLRVVCEEAFRCKGIIQKLLSLARPTGEGREAVSLAAVAAAVVSLVRGLPDYRDRRVTLNAPDGDGAGCTVTAVEGEMKQVVLNLTLNALEATPAGTGEVTIDVGRADGMVELSVRDNGRGMTPEVLERAFEPFFTNKHGDRAPGTGLGLSITNAIVSSHGGTIRAYSDGPGSGSRFVVRLPPAGAGAGGAGDGGGR